jgi:stage V sporulation protein G
MIMQVTEVDVAFVKPKDGLIAFASVVLDDQLYLSGIAIHSRLVGSGYRLTYPTRKVGEAQFSVFHPIRRPIGLAIEHAIVEKMKNVMRKRDAGLDRIDTGPTAF